MQAKKLFDGEKSWAITGAGKKNSFFRTILRPYGCLRSQVTSGTLGAIPLDEAFFIGGLLHDIFILTGVLTRLYTYIYIYINRHVINGIMAT